MKSSLSYLPEHKQTEILLIVDIIKEAVHPEMIILFGSYATGKWVEDSYIEDRILYEYLSDYDFLIVTADDKDKEYILTERITSRTVDRFKIPVSPIVHSIKFVNQGLEEGQYFFTEIIETGILLFDTGTFPFAEPRELTSEEQKQIAQDYYDLWFPKAVSGMDIAKYSFSNGNICDAAFMLHQTTERLYNCTLLVFNGYKPKTHNLEKLRRYTKPLSVELLSIFPDTSIEQYNKHLFDLLKGAYIDARYKRNYNIEANDFWELFNRITKMINIVQEICLKQIASID